MAAKYNSRDICSNAEEQLLVCLLCLQSPFNSNFNSKRPPLSLSLSLSFAMCVCVCVLNARINLTMDSIAEDFGIIMLLYLLLLVQLETIDGNFISLQDEVA